MSRGRPNGTIRSCKGVDSKKCIRCEKNKDVVNFQSYWYQPKRNKQPYGDPIRKRMRSCKQCMLKRE